MRRILSVAALAIVAVSASANAQARRGSTMSSANPSPEIGFDAGITFLSENGASQTDINIPAQHVRMGFFVSPVISIEPTFGLTRTSSQGTSVTGYNVGAGLLYHFSPSRADNQLYVRPFVDLVGASVDLGNGSSSSDSQVGFGVGLGMKVPLQDRFATRFEANVGRFDKTTAVGLLAGLSFYTR